MKLSEIPNGQVFVVVASNIQAFICGAYRAAFYKSGRVVLVYTDESREEARFSKAEAQALAANARLRGRRDHRLRQLQRQGVGRSARRRETRRQADL